MKIRQFVSAREAARNCGGEAHSGLCQRKAVAVHRVQRDSSASLNDPGGAPLPGLGRSRQEPHRLPQGRATSSQESLRVAPPEAVVYLVVLLYPAPGTPGIRIQIPEDQQAQGGVRFVGRMIQAHDAPITQLEIHPPQLPVRIVRQVFAERARYLCEEAGGAGTIPLHIADGLLVKIKHRRLGEDPGKGFHKPVGVWPLGTRHDATRGSRHGRPGVDAKMQVRSIGPGADRRKRLASVDMLGDLQV